MKQAAIRQQRQASCVDSKGATCRYRLSVHFSWLLHSIGQPWVNLTPRFGRVSGGEFGNGHQGGSETGTGSETICPQGPSVDVDVGGASAGYEGLYC